MVWAVLLFHPYLGRNRFTICTDHDSIKWILSLSYSSSSGRIARWRLRLSKCDFDVVHHAGIKHQPADALSRLPISGADTTTLEDDLLLLEIETLGNTDTVIHFVDTVSRPHSSLDVMHVISDTPDGTEDTPATPAIAEFIRKQAKETYCRATTSKVGQLNAEFPINYHCLLVRRSTIDGAVRITVPTQIR